MTTYLIPPVYQVQLIRDPNEKMSDRQQIKSPDDAIKIMSEFLALADREHFVVLMLDTKNRVIGLNTVAIGTLNSALVTARETFKPAIVSNSAAIILAHNHPSGDPTPSPEDVKVTQNLVEAGKILGIEVLDHIIIGEDKTASMKERGLGFN